MRTIALFVCALLFGGVVWAVEPALPQGTQTIGVAGDIDTDGPDGTSVDANLAYGYFVMDNLEVGGEVSYWDAGGDWTVWGIGGLGRYYFPTATQWVPYVGAGASWVDADIGVFDDSTFTLAGAVGVDLFLTDSAAIDFGLTYTWADDEIFEEDGSVEDTDLRILVGMRIFF